MSKVLFVSLLFGLLLGACTKTKTKVIEINSVPFPFNVNGTQPYVVWVNGERVDMPHKEIMALVNKIGEENIKRADSKDIHRGWLFSHLKGDPSHEFQQRQRTKPQ